MKYFPFLICIFLLSCQGSYHPKPLSYNRIDLPEKTKRVQVNSPCLWQSYASTESRFLVDPKNKCWITWAFKPYNAELFLTYLPINSDQDLAQYLDEMHQLSFDHQHKANSIDVQANTLASGNLVLEYKLTGNAATPYQFCITDSTKHYLRGALYFRHEPNFDSVYPVLQYLEKEVGIFMDSLKWKN